MYQILIKIPTASFIDGSDMNDVIQRAQNYDSRVGQIQASNATYNIVGYVSDTDNSSVFDTLKIDLPEIIVISNEIEEG